MNTKTILKGVFMGQNNNDSNKISLTQLVLLGLGSLIGSGWLFGAWEASSVAVLPQLSRGLLDLLSLEQFHITTLKSGLCSHSLVG